MTMLIAGHETTAAVLTWATFELAQRPAVLAKAQQEVDRVLGDRRPTLEVRKAACALIWCDTRIDETSTFAADAEAVLKHHDSYVYTNRRRHPTDDEV